MLHICFVLAIAVNFAFARQDSINNEVVITEAERKVDIATHIVKTSTVCTIENTGRSSLGFFLVPIDQELQNYLSYFSASVSFAFSFLSKNSVYRHSCIKNFHVIVNIIYRHKCKCTIAT